MWKYKDKEINKLQDLPDHENVHGFIYLTTHIPTGKKYIGKKVLFFNRKKKLTKKEISEWSKPGRVAKSRVVTIESDWMKYYGSDKWIMSQIKEGRSGEFVREILLLVPTKKQLTFYEVYYQMTHGVLMDDSYLNDSILGKFFRRDFL